MTAIFTVDDAMGLAFNGRRQSRDAAVTKDMLETFGPIAYDAYAAPLFPVPADPESVCRFFEREAPSLDPYDRVVLYRWNRTYPADAHLDLDWNGWRLVSSHGFAGTSHDQIIREIYEKK